MATYNQQDIFLRIKALLPSRWFGDETPLLDLVIQSLSTGWDGLFGLLSFVRAQTRIMTSSGHWLDLSAADYLGARFKRRQSEADRFFRQRIIAELRKDRCTRGAMRQNLTDLTGVPPQIFEPSNPMDTGCYGHLGTSALGQTGYGLAGGWGNLYLPFQAFIQVFRSSAPGVSMINGWGGSGGGYGAGQSAFLNTDLDRQLITDTEIYESIAQSAPAGCIMWVAIHP